MPIIYFDPWVWCKSWAPYVIRAVFLFRSIFLHLKYSQDPYMMTCNQYAPCPLFMKKSTRNESARIFPLYVANGCFLYVHVTGKSPLEFYMWMSAFVLWHMNFVNVCVCVCVCVCMSLCVYGMYACMCAYECMYVLIRFRLLTHSL